MPKRTDIKTLRQRLADLKAQGRDQVTRLDQLEAVEAPTEDQAAEIGTLTASVTALEAEVEAAQKELDAAQARLERERLFAHPAPSAPARRITSSEPDPERTGGFRDIADFALAVRRASDPSGGIVVDDRLRQRIAAAPANFHQESGGTAGEGYNVPPVFREQIFDLMLDEPFNLMEQVDNEPTASNSVEFIRDETTPWGATGVQARWRSEASQMSGSKLDDKSEQLRLGELYAFVLATEDLLEDAPRLNSRLSRQAARAIVWKANEAIMFGDGVGKPKGWMNSGALVTVAKETSQVAATIVAPNVAKMYARLLSGGLSRAVWLINSDALPQFLTMTLGDKPIWTPPASGFANAPGGFLFGRPVVPTEHCQTVGTVGDIQFVDPMGYYSPRKAGGVRFAESMHLFFDYNIRAFRWTFRIGGQAYLSAPVSPAKGSSTKSHFVALATRA